MPVTSPSLASSPHDPHPSRGRPWPNMGDGGPERPCGRCRRFFDSEPEPEWIDAWWLCDPCHDALFGARP